MPTQLPPWELDATWAVNPNREEEGVPYGRDYELRIKEPSPRLPLEKIRRRKKDNHYTKHNGSINDNEHIDIIEQLGRRKKKTKRKRRRKRKTIISKKRNDNKRRT